MMKRIGMSVLLLGLLTCSAMGMRRLPFVNDNYDQALAEAKQRKLPLFVDVWAPW
jgi:hypothetical protein